MIEPEYFSNEDLIDEVENIIADLRSENKKLILMELVDRFQRFCYGAGGS